MQNNKGKKEYILNKVCTYFQYDLHDNSEAERAIKAILLGLNTSVTVEQVCEEYEHQFGNDQPCFFNAFKLTDIILTLTE
ncbi:hypothetical protein [Pseudoalteromonas sp. S2893]|uniref:hypothetical protein n=1 Tax=Pseudoalteromonas sp. S2893 TaxID=579530 RepID=UPI00110B3C6F|nr:hypothetical protein [Pseudoalteromonas sp. S2893]TMP17015.1 hypothetical protein CWC04_09890 [Pseudoalteromonas sp. S2893]